jgi:drug/metabolite transporter (DMT)-like permease
MKLLLTEVPPFTIRGVGAVVAVLLLGGIALRLGESLAVPRGLWPRLVVASLLNVTAWMGLATFSLLWLTAGEATIVCYTMAVWAALMARLVLGEPLTLRRVLALGLALCGLAVLVLGQGVQAGATKLPGVALALSAAMLFSLGTVVTKRWPLGLPPTASVVWQTGLGCLPLAVCAVIFERVDLSAVSARGWALLAYGGAVALGVAYLAWFAALKRLPAAAAASGTLLTPVVGVLGAAFWLGEPLGWRELGALSLTIAGVVLAIRG